jgi:hypothetical protein
MGTFSVTPTVAEGMMNTTGFATSLGSSPSIVIYSGTPPTNANTALSGNTALATLACSATPISGVTFNSSGGPDANGTAVATFGAITNATAVATGTATFWRLLTSASTVIAQGSVGTSSADLVLNTTAITSGSTVSITSATISLPTGP